MNGSQFNKFCQLRTKLWNALKKVDMSYGCKSYEGAIEVTEKYPDFFVDKSEENKPCVVGIKLHCYVLGPARHYDFFDVSLEKALEKFEAWIEENADESDEP